jgi:hypothetical protein
MFGARLSRIPLLGRLVRRIANAYAVNMHRAYLLTPAEAEDLVDIAEGVAVGPATPQQAVWHRQRPRQAPGYFAGVQGLPAFLQDLKETLSPEIR